MQSHKEIATGFLKLVVRGKAEEAFRLHAANNFRHHNPYFKSDGESLMHAMDENAKQNPEKALDIKRVIEEGDLVCVHSFVKHNQADRGYALVHIFRFEQDKIEELWDLAMQVPAEVVNEHGLF